MAIAQKTKAFRDVPVGARFTFDSEGGVYSDAAGGVLAWQGARGPWEKLSPQTYKHVGPCKDAATVSVRTIYGTFEMCAECAEALPAAHRKH